MNMKKIILTGLLLLPVFAVRADERSQEILRKMGATFNGYNSYSIEFTATMQGEFQDLDGFLIVSGDKYYLDVYDSEIFFDGRNGYTYSESNDEVIIETPDPNDTRLFANPTRIFSLYERDFNSNFKGTVTVNGKSTSQIELTPKSNDMGYSKVTLYADAQGMPVRLIYRINEYGNDLVINVSKITANVPVTRDTFLFDPTKYPGVEIIDFR